MSGFLCLPLHTWPRTKAQHKPHMAYPDVSDHVINHQIQATASKIQTETATGSHIFTVCGYSLTKGVGVGKCISSDVFCVDESKWMINYYPDGYDEEHTDYINFFLEHKVEGAVVKAKFSFTILQEDGVPTKTSCESQKIYTFRGIHNQGFKSFVRKTKFEESGYLKDDTFRVKCTVTIIKGHHLKAINHYDVSVPPSNLKQNLAHLLESGNGYDVTFVVKGERFNAHRCVLAARSAVFSAELFGCMQEKWTNTINVDDIEASVFKYMLYFIYSDSLPDFDGTNNVCENHDLSFMAQHLLVAADRYALERLRLICEDVLCKNLCVSNAATTLILAEQHNCSQLKAGCIRFISSSEVFKAVTQTDEFQTLMRICPSIVKDIEFSI